MKDLHVAVSSAVRNAVSLTGRGQGLPDCLPAPQCLAILPGFGDSRCSETPRGLELAGLEPDPTRSTLRLFVAGAPGQGLENSSVFCSLSFFRFAAHS
ncbi:hypothetical protein ElyMa_003330400 [Elysia marginata]|uniref:Uncharacterized protein n=1 Tax=Elysia marginata TaxID=1093978 RepID=A0AAV4JFG4_9GAST|nr:hypothetical protein ElyMa_003330400 [Elysia marginata]